MEGGSEFFYNFFNFLGHKILELRIINIEGKVLADYLNVDTAEKFAKICREWNGRAQVYVGLQERDGKGGKAENVTCVRWILIDVDVKRSDKKLPATAKELENARRNCSKILDWLRENGIEPNLVVESGNGYHILIRINDVAVTAENREILGDVINYGLIRFIREKIVDSTVDVDSTGDLPRVVGVPGTINMKGQRLRRIVYGNINEKPQPQLAMEALIQNLYENYLMEKRRMQVLEKPAAVAISEDELLNGMCPARRDLWLKGAPVGQRSHAIHYLMIHFACRGLDRDRIDQLLRSWDERTGMEKFTQREKDMYEYDYEKTSSEWPHFGVLDVSCQKMREHGFCRAEHEAECLQFIKKRRSEMWKKIKEPEKITARPNFNLPLDFSVLIEKCSALQRLVDKIKRDEVLGFDERETLYLTLIFLSEPGRQKLKELMGRCRGAEFDNIDRRIERYVREGFFPISCTKIKQRMGHLCGDCQGATTPIEYAFGNDPNKAEVIEIELHELKSELLNKFVGIPCRVAGIGSTYSVPYIFKAQCVDVDVNLCRLCPLFSGEILTLNDLRAELNPFVDLTIDVINTSEAGINAKIKSYLNRYAENGLKCKRKDKRIIEFEVLKERTLTPLVVYPSIGELKVEEGYSGQARQLKAYLKEHFAGGYVPGILYGNVRRHPKTGELTIVGSLFKPSEFWREKRKFTKGETEKMDVLKNINYNELIDIISTHVCGIIGRPEAVEAVLIAYHTPLHFTWKGKVEPCWPHVVLFGDTTTGKRIPRMIRSTLSLGTYIVMETASRTGLLYSIQYLEKRQPLVVLGELALADRGLLIIDGYDRMQKEEKREFSEAYRTGILKVRRDAKLDAHMRVRLITCENVEKPLSHYLYPCTALLDNYTAPDVARIDFAIPFRAEDVPSDKFLRKWPEPPEKINEIIEALKLNVVWAWSLKPEQIKFTPEAEMLVFERAKEFDLKFGSSRLPLVSKDIDKKIAKLAIGYAILRRSVDDEGNVTVDVEHVQHVADLMDRVYGGEAMRLDEYAETERKRSQLTEEEFGKIYGELMKEEENKLLPLFNIILEELQLRGTTHLSELEAIVEEELGAKAGKTVLKQRMTVLKGHRLVISSKNGYSLTPKGIAFIHKYKKLQLEPETKEHAVLLDSEIVRLARLYPEENGKCQRCGKDTALEYQAETEDGKTFSVCINCALIIQRNNPDVEWLE
jgi:predicted transcriptional regulator